MGERNIGWIRYFSRGQHPILYIDTVMLAHRDIWHSYFNLPKINYWARHSGSLWVDKDEMEEMYKLIRKKLETKWTFKTANKIKKDVSNLLKFSEKMKNGELTKALLKKLEPLMWSAWQSTYFPIIIGKVIEEEVSEAIKNYPEEKKKRILILINIPLYKIERQRYIDALKKISHNPNERNIKKIIKNFGWIKSYVMDIKPLTRQDVLDALHRLKEKQKTPNIIMNNKLARLIKLGRLYCWLRDWRLFQIGRFYYNIKPFFEKRGKELGLNYEQLRQLRWSEFVTGKFNFNRIKQREREYAILLYNEKVKVVSDPKELKKVKTWINEKIEAIGFVRGVIANKGLAVGRARIANAYSFSRLKQGEILITPETTPEAVPYLKGIKAIVTDEGGITSHAAIISRELNVPCIIATKIASKIFKDGDLVEVDANKGVVRKLN